MEDENNLICSPTSELDFEVGFANGNNPEYSDKPQGKGPIVQYQSVQSRPLITRDCLFDERTGDCERVVTPQGPLEVYYSGLQPGSSSPTIITFHDIGLDYLSNFKSFFSSPAMSSIEGKFRVLHVTAPGMKPNSPDLPEDFQYPSMEALSESVEYICHHYGVSTFVGLGVGLGANVLVRLAFRRPKLVEGLILLNSTVSTASWVEWAYHKKNLKSLLKKSLKFPESVSEYLVWYHLGTLGGDRCIDSMSLASIYRQHFGTQVNQNNLSLLIQAYVTRTEVKLARDLASNGKTMYGACRTLKMPVINMVGDQSPHVDATVTFNGKLDPARCTWMKIQDAGMVLEEQPLKAAEAIRLFLQGLGYTLRTARSKSLCQPSVNALTSGVDDLRIGDSQNLNLF